MILTVTFAQFQEYFVDFYCPRVSSPVYSIAVGGKVNRIAIRTNPCDGLIFEFNPAPSEEIFLTFIRSYGWAVPLKVKKIL